MLQCSQSSCQTYNHQQCHITIIAIITPLSSLSITKMSNISRFKAPEIFLVRSYREKWAMKTIVVRESTTKHTKQPSPSNQHTTLTLTKNATTQHLSPNAIKIAPNPSTPSFKIIHKHWGCHPQSFPYYGIMLVRRLIFQTNSTQQTRKVRQHCNKVFVRWEISIWAPERDRWVAEYFECSQLQNSTAMRMQLGQRDAMTEEYVLA